MFVVHKTQIILWFTILSHWRQTNEPKHRVDTRTERGTGSMTWRHSKLGRSPSRAHPSIYRTRVRTCFPTLIFIGTYSVDVSVPLPSVPEEDFDSSRPLFSSQRTPTSGLVDFGPCGRRNTGPTLPFKTFPWFFFTDLPSPLVSSYFSPSVGF